MILLFYNIGLPLLLDYLWGIETGADELDQEFDRLLLDYLWGIETISPPSPTSSSSTLLDYLWGIETRMGRQYMGRCKRVTRLPMRNWNQITAEMVQPVVDGY